MGITGLLPLLNNAKKPVHIREYFGKVVAIDGHCWLHQGAISCAMDLALGRSTTKYITYFMHRIELLRFHNVIPYVVFDGQPLPIKAATNAIRAVKRQEGRNKALDLLKSGNNKEAYKYFQQSISITVEMIQGVIHELDKINVKHIVAPYEADSQLTFLIQNHIVDAIITEDSDMIPFGCSDVIYKMNKFGDGILIKMDAIMQSNIFRDFNMVKLKWMCILSGCDYLPSVPGVGLKKAQNMIDKYTCIEKIMDSLTLKDDDYVKNFNRALDAFLYQFVYDPHKKEYVRLNSLPVGEEDRDLSYLGDQPDDHTNEILKTNHTTRIVKEVFKYCENNKENIQVRIE
ncbi:PIN domain-like protein [Pilobolus umbonatus]|nr:PIN domain-like protein [Pilobolus umbonatus]